jgi:hypothetical protein
MTRHDPRGLRGQRVEALQLDHRSSIGWNRREGAFLDTAR